MWHSSFLATVLLCSIVASSPAHAWGEDPPTVGVGATCGGNIICRSGLRCQGHVCRIKRSRECTATPKFCVRGAVCAGTKSRRVCTRALRPGARCEEQKYSACRKGLKCSGKRCRTPTGKSCRARGSLCFEGATCAGSGKNKKCVEIIAPGGRCKENNVFSVCAKGTACSGGVCKTPEGGSCIRSGSVCIDGTTCTGTDKVKKCVSIIAPGGKCVESDPFSVCTTGTSCDGGICKTPKGGSCLAAGSVCVSGTTCTGTDKVKKCVSIIGPGGKCVETDPFSVCTRGTSCDGGICKTPKGGSCLASGSVCVRGTTCAGTEKEKKCVPIIAPGGKCVENDAFSVCTTGTTCDDGVCKTPKGGSCLAAGSVCVSGTTCAGSDKDKKCVAIVAPGGKCVESDPLSVCTTGTSCTDGICKTPKGESCLPTGSVCVSGTTCAGTEKDKKCVGIIEPGSKCTENDPFSVCGRNTVCKQGVCKTPKGQSCLTTGSVCVDGTTCAGTEKEKKCVDIIAPGGKCREGNVFSVCADGTTCSDGICRTPRGKSCLPAGSVCVDGTTCAGTEKDKKCVPILNPGAKCQEGSPFSVCRKDLVCSDGICKTPRGGECEPSGSVCITSTICVGREGKKRCVTPRPIGKECGTNIFRVCQSGLVCENNRCNTPRIPKGGNCQASGSRCEKGLICLGKMDNKRCVEVFGPNKACDPTKFNVCKEGLVCSGGRCKTPVGGDCMPTGSICVSGAMCIGTKKRKICAKPSKLGEKCDSPFLKCDGKLICFRRRCVLPKRSLGKECSHSVRCQDGLSCRYIRFKRKAFCIGVSKRGGKCGTFLRCRFADRCRFGKCVRRITHPW